MAKFCAAQFGCPFTHATLTSGCASAETCPGFVLDTRAHTNDTATKIQPTKEETE